MLNSSIASPRSVLAREGVQRDCDCNGGRHDRHGGNPRISGDGRHDGECQQHGIERGDAADRREHAQATGEAALHTLGRTVQRELEPVAEVDPRAQPGMALRRVDPGRGHVAVQALLVQLRGAGLHAAGAPEVTRRDDPLAAQARLLQQLGDDHVPAGRAHQREQQQDGLRDGVGIEDVVAIGHRPDDAPRAAVGAELLEYRALPDRQPLEGVRIERQDLIRDFDVVHRN